ncbi:MAG: hypothetical protein LBH20_10280 [Treponema sp.]|jgi:O-glycosyl hydrolase|nr:hypothetical protein [Treponema sp.]
MDPNATITMNSNRKYQYVRGFGGMDIPWDNFFEIKRDEYEKLYHPETGLGLNIIRIMIMPENPTDNTNIRLTNEYYVSGEGNRPLFFDSVKIVNGYNGYALASPWSPPPDWKSNGTKNGGGHLIETYYGAYKNYLRDFCQDMLDHGAPIYAVSIQNEPNFMATYDGCEWTSNQMRDFFKTQGHFTDGIKGWGGGAETETVFTMNGESANHPNINDAALNDPESRAVIDIIGRHIYGNVQVRYTEALDKTPKKEVWMTEHNINSGNVTSYPNDSTWNYVWAMMNDVDVSIRLNDESAFIWWALKRFYSFIGDGQYGTIEGAILPRGYAMSHYAKFAKESWRIALSVSGKTANGTDLSTRNFNNGTFDRNGTDVKATAYVSEDGNTISMVLFTPTTNTGTGGVDMGTIKIQLPQGFTVKTATGMRSTAAVKAKTEEVLLSNDRTAAFVMLPPSTILSLRFTR